MPVPPSLQPPLQASAMVSGNGGTKGGRALMSRESEFYRDNLEQVLEYSKGRQMLNIKETMEFTGIKSYATVGKMFPFFNGYISVATLARCMARKEK